MGPDGRGPADGVGSLSLYNPATGEVIDQVPLSGSADVDAAVKAAVAAYKGWSRTPLMERVRLMFRFKALLEDHVEDLPTIITPPHAKPFDQSPAHARAALQ